MAGEKHYFIKLDCGTSREDALHSLKLLLEDGWSRKRLDIFESEDIDVESEEEDG